jgi:hypothetical protein
MLHFYKLIYVILSSSYKKNIFMKQSINIDTHIYSCIIVTMNS